VSRYILSRLVLAAVMALLATLVIFLLANTVPGDPVLAQLGDLAASNKEFVAEWRAKWGLDLPLWQRYVIFLQQLLHGDLGISISSQRPVLQDIPRLCLPQRWNLPALRSCCRSVVGIPLGIMAAVRRDSWIDHVARLISLIGVSSPTFWLAFIMLALFYGGLQIAPGPGTDRCHCAAAPVGHRALSDRQRVCRRLGHVPRCAGASSAALNRARGGHARSDHPHDPRQHAREHAAGLCARCARQGHPRAPHRDRPHPAECPDFRS
jgi:ABC-type dipeptide/oligopeptide/nickel transport system permease component